MISRPRIYIAGKPVSWAKGAAALLKARRGASPLFNAYQTAFDEAKAANEQRYRQILDLLAKRGAQQRTDIRQRWASLQASGLQDLVSRGLTATTVLPTMRMGYQREMGAELGRLEDRLLAQQLGFMERRTDAYPDYGQMAQLAMAQGRAGPAPFSSAYWAEKDRQAAMANRRNAPAEAMLERARREWQQALSRRLTTRRNYAAPRRKRKTRKWPARAKKRPFSTWQWPRSSDAATGTYGGRSIVRRY